MSGVFGAVGAAGAARVAGAAGAARVAGAAGAARVAGAGVSVVAALAGMDRFLVMLVLCMAGAFALCGIPFGLYIARALGGVDVRETGSGNIGMTNVARSVGAVAGGLTLVCDAGKGFLALMLARFALTAVAPSGVLSEGRGEGFAALTLVFACCILGHVFSPYLHFKGGKGISVGFGAALGLYWPLGLGLLVVFCAGALPSRYVSLGSVLAAISLPIQCVLLWHMSLWATLPLLIAAAVVIWAHRANIARLAQGEERKFSLGHAKSN